MSGCYKDLMRVTGINAEGDARIDDKFATCDDTCARKLTADGCFMRHKAPRIEQIDRNDYERLDKGIWKERMRCDEYINNGDLSIFEETMCKESDYWSKDDNDDDCDGEVDDVDM